MATQPSRLEANRLYWDTDTSVGHIADALGLSRRALYDLLEPLPAEQPCPACGSPLLFPNRLARAAGEAICGTCGAEERLPPTPRTGPARPSDALGTRSSGPAARQRPPRTAAEAAAARHAAGGADATPFGNGVREPPPPPVRERTASVGAARDGSRTTDGNGPFSRAAHALGLADEREATLALARALRVLGFALIGVAAGMAITSFLKRRS